MDGEWNLFVHKKQFVASFFFFHVLKPQWWTP